MQSFLLRSIEIYNNVLNYLKIIELKFQKCYNKNIGNVKNM